MKGKVLFKGIIFLSLILFLTCLAAAEKIAVKVERANLRLKPDLQSPVVTVVLRGTILEVKGKEGEWYRVTLFTRDKGELSGYIRQDLVEEFKEKAGGEERARTEGLPIREKTLIPPRERPRPERGKLRAIGLKLGYNSANLYGANIEEFEEFLQYEMKSKAGLNLGGFIIVNLTRNLALESELAYTAKGARSEENVMGEKVEAWINLSYLEIPALLRFYIPTETNFQPSLYAGIYSAIKLSGKAKAEYAGVKAEIDIENLKSTDAGLILGAGAEFALPFLRPGRVALELRYTLGLTSISTQPDVETKNKVFSISLGYFF